MPYRDGLDQVEPVVSRVLQLQTSTNNEPIHAHERPRSLHFHLPIPNPNPNSQAQRVNHSPVIHPFFLYQQRVNQPWWLYQKAQPALNGHIEMTRPRDIVAPDNNSMTSLDDGLYIVFR